MTTHHLDPPRFQHKFESPKAATAEIPTQDGYCHKYKAAGKLEGNKAVNTGEDSGIGRAVAVFFAMEDAHGLMNYLPEEGKDAQETKETVEKYGGRCVAFTRILSNQMTNKGLRVNAVYSSPI